jgi:DNA-directed RNA polymerase specialized sigma24 family protein
MEFPSTHWGILAQATLHGDASATGALAEFHRRYRQPIIQFIRWRGFPGVEAEDVAHDFLLHLMEKSVLKRADATRGRFRSFLLGVLMRFLGDERDRRDALKRGGGTVGLDLPDAELTGELATDSAVASEAFDREWALGLLGLALQRLEEEYGRHGRGAEYAVLRAYVPGGVRPPAYEEAAARLGQSLGGFKTEVYRLRQRFRVLLRAEIAGTVTSRDEINAEIAYLGRVLRTASGR